ncbi:MAG: AAA family ATPase [Nannocystaceae bacterium]|nr:AAA family ATPase [Nannocystaceae bacterium]
MATTVEVGAAIVVREMSSGGVYAYPLADPKLASRANSVDAALQQQERFLTRYLQKAPASALAGFSLPGDASMLEVPVVLTRSDLPRRIAVTEPVTVPCVLVPHEHSLWVQILPFETFVYLERVDDLHRLVAEAVEKAAKVQDLSASEMFARLPAARHGLHLLKLSVDREDAADVGARAQARRRRAKTRERGANEKLLAEVGTSLRVLHGKTRYPEVLGRSDEIDALTGLLAGGERLSVLLVGQELAGKSALMHGLVSRAVHGDGPDPLGGRMVVATSGAQLVAGQSGFGDLEQRVADVMNAAEELDVIVYFDNLGDLLSGRPGTIGDMVSGMLPYVTQDRVRLVGELTAEQVSHYEKMHVGFFAALSRVTVDPLNKDTTRRVLEARAAHVRTHEPHRPSLTRAALPPLLDLCDRYLAYEAFPGKAIRLHDELRAIHEAEVTGDGAPRPVGPAEVYRAFSARSGIPLFLLKEDRAVKLDEVERFFARRVVGQEEAVRRVAETVCMVKANLQPPGKPLATFLFIGPTGVGKTEVAKTLAQFLFGSGDRMVRFDMSEYMDPLAADRLIRGTLREEGELTRRVRRQPFCVILLDEIEKAHSAVFDLLLQVCGEGRLSDARGRTTWFNNAIIIMTSNLGAALRRPDAGFGATATETPKAIASYYLEQVDKHFRPEFVGRIDRVIPFSSLQRSEVSAVAQVAMRKLVERDGLLGRAITLDVSRRALDGLAEAGYSAAYGARALRRHLESALVGPLSGVMATHAENLDGARLVVSHPDDETPELQEGFTREGQDATNDLPITVMRPLGTQRRQGVHQLASIAALRRTADRCMHGPRVLVIRERLDYLIADLAGAQTKDSRGTLARAAAERGKLQGLIAEAAQHADAVADAEELAMAAVLEGADADLFGVEALDAFARFECAFVRLLAGHEGGDGIALFARSPGGARVHDLLSIIDAASAERGWDVIVHRVQDPELEDGWPAKARYGPPRSLAWWRERRNTESDKARARWSAVLIRVRGALAGPLLRFEEGLWHFKRGQDDRVDVLELVALGKHYEIPTSTLCPSSPVEDDLYAALPVRKSEELRRETPARSWAVVHGGWQVSLGDPASTFSFEALTDYAAALERVQFADRAAAGLEQEES